jgi:hypothetical protein
MNTIRDAVQGGPVVSCVECPKCRTFVPISEDNTRIIPPTTAITIVRPTHSDQPPITTRSTPTTNVPSIERRSPIINQPTQTANIRSAERGPPISTSSTYQPAPDNRERNQATIQVNPVSVQVPSNASEYERSWRSTFPRIPVYVLSIVQLVLIVLIFILEIASLAVASYQPTGVGIWGALAFLPACLLTFRLGE